MAALLRKILPVEKSTPIDDDINVEYSFAIEYHGPPITFDIPKLVPVDVDGLPTAAEVSSSFSLNDISLPVIQPIVKTNLVNQKGKNIGSEPSLARKSIVRAGLSKELSIKVDSLDSLSKRIDDGISGRGSCEIQEVSDVNNETPCHVRKPSVVTFVEPESCSTEESEYSEIESVIHDEQPLVRNGKKGTCYRCLKGNRFTKKEVCIVCNAK